MNRRLNLSKPGSTAQRLPDKHHVVSRGYRMGRVCAALDGQIRPVRDVGMPCTCLRRPHLMPRAVVQGHCPCLSGNRRENWTQSLPGVAAVAPKPAARGRTDRWGCRFPGKRPVRDTVSAADRRCRRRRSGRCRPQAQRSASAGLSSPASPADAHPMVWSTPPAPRLLPYSRASEMLPGTVHNMPHMLNRHALHSSVVSFASPRLPTNSTHHVTWIRCIRLYIDFPALICDLRCRWQLYSDGVEGVGGACLMVGSNSSTLRMNPTPT